MGKTVMLEAHRTRTWVALRGAYAGETVEDCVSETQTGYRLHSWKQWTVANDLRASLAMGGYVKPRGIGCEAQF